MGKVIELNSLTEARQPNSKDIDKMLKAIKDENEKVLLMYMKMDKKKMFSQRNLEYLVDDGDLSKEEAKKLSILSIGVAHALGAMSGSPDEKKDQKARAMARVKEVESMK